MQESVFLSDVIPVTVARSFVACYGFIYFNLSNEFLDLL